MGYRTKNLSKVLAAARVKLLILFTAIASSRGRRPAADEATLAFVLSQRKLRATKSRIVRKDRSMRFAVSFNSCLEICECDFPLQS